MYINLSGLTILVTGASRGIGYTLSKKMAEAGATLAVHYNKKAREAVGLAEKLGNQSKIFQANLENPTEAARLFEEVFEEMGNIDMVVNNAGIAEDVDLLVDDEQWLNNWNRTIAVNLSSTAIICKKAIQHFLSNNIPGKIINMTSRAAFRGDESSFVAYAASKAGLLGLTRSLARAYGKQGIKVFGIAPGFVKTDMALEFIKKYGEAHTTADIALGRLTEPKDIAPLVTLIASGMLDHATGQIFNINAGSYLH